jgi:thiamine biosynthesis lipoprotein
MTAADRLGAGDLARTRRVRAEPVMGTVVSIDTRLRAVPVDLDAALDAAVAELHRVDAEFSTFKAGSWVSRLRRHDIELDACPDQVREVYRLADACRAQTGGYFDPGWRGDGTLDPTGLVKGWAADRASAALTAAGATVHCVNAAGDLRVRGMPEPGRPWRIGIADPFARERFVAVVEATDLAVATSGTAEQGDHVVNPRTGARTAGMASVTVIGPDLAVADAYATAALAAGPAARDLLTDLGRAGWEWLTVDSTGRLDFSAGFRRHLTDPGQRPTQVGG